MKATAKILIALATLCSAICANAADLSQGLPLPSVPDSLRTPQARADYAIEHFWDAMDFSDTKYSLSEPFMEQTFANYATILGLASPGQGTQASVDSLLSRAAANKEARQLLLSIAHDYLQDPRSPLASDDLYLYFVDAQLRSPLTLPGERVRLTYQKKALLMNRPGTAPADFAFKGRDGQECTLHQAIAGQRTLLMLYSPDCDDCHRAMADIAANRLLQKMIADGSLQILAIADADQPDLWAEQADEVPACIIDGLDTTGIADQELYDIPYTPAFILINPDGLIALKHRPLSAIIEALVEEK